MRRCIPPPTSSFPILTLHRTASALFGGSSDLHTMMNGGSDEVMWNGGCKRRTHHSMQLSSPSIPCIFTRSLHSYTRSAKCLSDEAANDRSWIKWLQYEDGMGDALITQALNDSQYVRTSCTVGIAPLSRNKHRNTIYMRFKGISIDSGSGT